MKALTAEKLTDINGGAQTKPKVSYEVDQSSGTITATVENGYYYTGFFGGTYFKPTGGTHEVVIV